MLYSDGKARVNTCSSFYITIILCQQTEKLSGRIFLACRKDPSIPLHFITNNKINSGQSGREQFMFWLHKNASRNDELNAILDYLAKVFDCISFIWSSLATYSKRHYNDNDYDKAKLSKTPMSYTQNDIHIAYLLLETRKQSSLNQYSLLKITPLVLYKYKYTQ